MKKIIFLAALSIFGCKTLLAQHYNTAIGVKLLDGGGLTIKYFFKESNALEGIAYFNPNGVRITGLYEIYAPLADLPLTWYYGPGAHVGIYNTNHGNGSFVGIDGVLGIDWKINNAPIDLSLDWQPAIELGTGRGFYGGWGGLGIRFAF